MKRKTTARGSFIFFVLETKMTLTLKKVCQKLTFTPNIVYQKLTSEFKKLY